MVPMRLMSKPELFVTIVHSVPTSYVRTLYRWFYSTYVYYAVSRTGLKAGPALLGEEDSSDFVRWSSTTSFTSFSHPEIGRVGSYKSSL